MANRLFQTPRALQKEVILIQGIINLSAAAAVASTVGTGFSVAKTTTGTYTITLADIYPALEAAEFTLFEAAGGALLVKGVSHSVAASPATVVVKTCNTSGTATDTAAAISIHFALRLKNTSLSQ